MLGLYPPTSNSQSLSIWGQQNDTLSFTLHSLTLFMRHTARELDFICDEKGPASLSSYQILKDFFKFYKSFIFVEFPRYATSHFFYYQHLR